LDFRLDQYDWGQGTLIIFVSFVVVVNIDATLLVVIINF